MSDVCSAVFFSFMCIYRHEKRFPLDSHKRFQIQSQLITLFTMFIRHFKAYSRYVTKAPWINKSHSHCAFSTWLTLKNFLLFLLILTLSCYPHKDDIWPRDWPDETRDCLPLSVINMSRYAQRAHGSDSIPLEWAERAQGHHYPNWWGLFLIPGQSLHCH